MAYSGFSLVPFRPCLRVPVQSENWNERSHAFQRPEWQTGAMRHLSAKSRPVGGMSEHVVRL